MSRIRKAVGWVRSKRLVGVLAAVGLLLVPTVFSLFPGLLEPRTRDLRIAVMVLWGIAALVVTVAGSMREDAHSRTATQTHDVILRLAVEALLKRNAGAPANYLATVFLYDPDLDRLLPWYPQRVVDPDDHRVFAPGAGATGEAFRTDSSVVAIGDAVSNEEYHLSAEQQSQFSKYKAVFATPIRSLSGDRRGCLTLISERNDGHFARKDGRVHEDSVEEVERVADQIGNLL